MSYKTLARCGINDLKAYVPGKSMEEVKEQYGCSEIIKLASNENPLGTSLKAIEAIRQTAADAYMYPEGSSLLLRRKLAEMFAISQDMVLFGNGADNILRLIAQAFINEGDEVVMGDTSFAAYETVTRIMGGTAIKVPLHDFTYDLPALAAKITGKTKLIFICNPNNPTGTMVTEEEVADFMKLVPPQCIVVFDEAYAEYVKEKTYPQTINYVHQGSNVIIVRTFSKIFGLAGLRVGYALAPARLVNNLLKVVEPFATNRLAQAGALAALDDTEFVNKVLQVNEDGKLYLCQAFDQLGMAYLPSYTNFIFVNLGMDGQFVFEKLLEQGIVIRPGGLWDLPQFARITIGTPDQNRKLIEALEETKLNYNSCKE